MAEVLKVALVGIGKIATDQHVPTLSASPDWQLAATVSRNGSVEGVEAFRDIDAMLAAGGVAGALCDRIEAAGPYGAGWPAPRVAVGPVRLLNVGVVGNGHVRLRAVGDDQRGFKAIAFRAADTAWGQALLHARPDERFWLAGVMKRDEWTGGDAAEMHLEDAARA